MVIVITPNDAQNPRQWLENLTDITLVFGIRETTGKELSGLFICIDDGKERGHHIHSYNDYAVIQLADYQNPVQTPFNVAIGASYNYNLSVEWNAEKTVTLPETVTGIPDQWIEGLNNLDILFVLRETSGKKLFNFTIHLDDGMEYTYTFSTKLEWIGFQVKELKNNLGTPYKIGITSTTELNVGIFAL